MSKITHYRFLGGNSGWKTSILGKMMGQESEKSPTVDFFGGNSGWKTSKLGKMMGQESADKGYN